MDDTAQRVRKERISFKAAYGNERVFLNLMLPKTGKPPFQPVVFIPGATALSERNGEAKGPAYIVASGRALVCPVFKGMYERSDGQGVSDYFASMNLYRDSVIQWSKDLARTIDYLETRKDIRSDKIAYLGFSWGAQLGAVLPAVEHRLKALVLLSGGMSIVPVPPEVDQVNFAPRITIPTLMLNGRYDFTFILPSQQQLFRLLGTPAKDKQHLLYESGHVGGREEWPNEIGAWLDRYLGPVNE